VSDASRLLRFCVLVLAAAAALAALHAVTRERIAANEAAHRLQKLRGLLPDAIGRGATLVATGDGYTAVHDGRVVARIRPLTARDGYAGPIELLLATDAAAQVVGIDIIAHRETPGLGDRIEREHGDWLAQLLGATRERPPRLRADGGDLDAITGATITSRAVADAVAGALAVPAEEARPVPPAPATAVAPPSAAAAPAAMAPMAGSAAMPSASAASPVPSATARAAVPSAMAPVVALPANAQATPRSATADATVSAATAGARANPAAR
jgi:electron transport complex protein RnfG